MKIFALKVRRFLRSDDGPTAVEYAVMLSLIIAVCFTAVRAVGNNTKTSFTNMSNSLSGMNGS